MHERLGGQGLVSVAAWPTFRKEDLLEDSVELAVQTNSKLKGRITVPTQASKEEVEQLVRGHAELSIWTANQPIQKVIVVPGRIVNLITA